jgi:hypothetical protein
VDDDLRSPRVDDGFKVLGSRHELEVGEDLGQEEAALRVADELIEAWELRRPLGPEPFVGTSMERIEPGVARPTRVRLTRSERDRVPSAPRLDREGNQRLEMTSKRSGREQHPRRCHRTIFAATRLDGRVPGVHVRRRVQPVFGSALCEHGLVVLPEVGPSKEERV